MGIKRTQPKGSESRVSVRPKRSPAVRPSAPVEENDSDDLPTGAITEEDRAAAEKQISSQSKRIEFFITEYSHELLAAKMKNGKFVVPGYQREFTWDEPRKHRFVESLLMGLPIPFLFFWEMEEGQLEIVDGTQRLHTLVEFIHGGLRLGRLESLPSVSGFTFADLPESRQNKFLNRSIRGIVLNEHADEQARFDMFERINTGSKAANKAEVRRGALAGPFMDLVIRLALNPSFIKLAPLPPKDVNEREHEELVARFFAYGDGLEGYEDRPAEFVFNYAKKMNKKFATEPALAANYQNRFERTLKFVAATFPLGFRKSAGAKKTYRARFEALAIGSWRTIEAHPKLESKPRQLSPASWPYEPDGAFAKVTGADGANAKKRLLGRIEFVRDRLLEAKR